MLSKRSLTLKAELLIQAYRWLVIRINLKLKSREVEPVIRQVKPCIHQRLSNTLALPLIMYAHPDCSDVPPPRSIRESMQPHHPHHTVADDRHQVVRAVASVREPLPPLFKGRIWQLKRPRKNLRATKYFVKS